ncbi:MAG: TPR repeat-containing protein [Methanomicrobiales archaeon 53_19]|nr:tetratricopeptide repeat protein [Methanocalculus sp.]KUK70782.1 MAG: TPR repeat-containing protein [Methanocalculus sp. 52_23]KUL04611.1 MAG: TPR repeat-containing protein [Methanomicrobiales archaeon 53_19]
MGLFDHHTRDDASVFSLIEEGTRLYESGQYAHAIESFEKAVDLNPGRYDAWSGYGSALLQMERYPEAVDAYDRALRLNPDMPDIWSNHGVALARLGRHEEGLASLNRALLLDPVHYNSWMNKARILWECGQTGDAVLAYDRACAINPMDGNAWYHRGVLLAEIGRTGESVQSIEKAREIGYDTGIGWCISIPAPDYIGDIDVFPEPDDEPPRPSADSNTGTLECGDALSGEGGIVDPGGDPISFDYSLAVSVLPKPDGSAGMSEEDDADPDGITRESFLPEDSGTGDLAKKTPDLTASEVPDGSLDGDFAFGDDGDASWEEDLLYTDADLFSPEIADALSDMFDEDGEGNQSPSDGAGVIDSSDTPEPLHTPDADSDGDPGGSLDGYSVFNEVFSEANTSLPRNEPLIESDTSSSEDDESLLQRDSSFAEILIYYDRAVVRSPDAADLWYNRGLVLYNLNRYRDAVESFERAVAINPDYAEAERNRRILVALIKKKIVDYERKGTECATEGRFDEAVVYYDQVLSLDPEAPSVWYNRGVALRNLGRYSEAVASYDHALSLAPDDPGTWYNRGVALRNLGRYSEAVDSYDRALALDSDDADTWHNRGVALRKLGRYDDAVTSFDRALSLNQEDVDIWYNRGVALRKLSRYEDALESYDRMLVLDPNNILALNNRGFILNEMSRYEEAAESYNKSILLNPENAAPWVGRGIAEFNLGHYAAAVESLNRALGIDHEDSYAWQVHGLAHARLNHHAEAVLSYDRASALDPSDARIWVIRGLSLMGIGNYHEAVLSFERARTLDPDNPDILSHRDEAARMIPVEERILPVEETALRSGVEPGPVSPTEVGRSRSPAASFSVTLDHSRFIRNQWHRVRLTIRNEGGDPVIDLLISFSEDFATRRLIPVTVPPADQVTLDVGIKPLSVGMVPLDLKADYRDEKGHEYTRIFEFWIEVLPEP